REDLGAVDNLAIVPPTFPFLVGFLPGAGSLANLFAPGSNPAFPTGIPPLGAQPTQQFVPTASILQTFSLNTGTPFQCSYTVLEQCSPVFNGNVNSLIQLAVPQHWVAGTTQQWNLSIQRELGRNWFAELGYVGTKGTHLRSTYDPAEAQLATPQHPVTIPGVNCDGTKGTGA